MEDNKSLLLPTQQQEMPPEGMPPRVHSVRFANAPTTFKTYRMRWHMLAIFCLQSMLNAFLWICFAPIDDYTARYFSLFKGDGSSGKSDTSLVNILSVTFLVLYLPGSILASYIMSRYGLRRVVIVGAVLNASAAVADDKVPLTLTRTPTRTLNLPLPLPLPLPLAPSR